MSPLAPAALRRNRSGMTRSSTLPAIHSPNTKSPPIRVSFLCLVEHRSPYTNTRSPPIRSPVSAGPNRKRKKDAADMQFSRLLRNRGNGMELRSSDVVEARRVELLSENASKGTSPGADACFGIAPVFLCHRTNVKPMGRVASLCMVRSKLCARTSASNRRPASGPRHSRRGRVTA